MAPRSFDTADALRFGMEQELRRRARKIDEEMFETICGRAPRPASDYPAHITRHAHGILHCDDVITLKRRNGVYGL